MARARKIIQLSKRHISNQERAAREEAEKNLKVGRDQLSPPAWLDDVATNEFGRVVREAGSVKLLDNLDLGVLAIYANAWSGYVRMVQHCQRDTEIGIHMDRYGGHETLSPWFRAEEKYIAQIMQCSVKLGLATSDRLKLVVPQPEQIHENKFLKYIK